MRATAILVLATAVSVVPSLAQQQTTTDLPTYSAEERWERAGRLWTVTFAGAIAYAKSMGQSAKQYGEFTAELMASGWGEPDSGSVTNVIQGVRRNMPMWPNAEFEITESSKTSVTGRVNRPWVQHFDDDNTLYGVSLAEFEEVLRVFNRQLAEYLGLQYEGEIEGDWLSMTFSQNVTPRRSPS